MEPKHRSPGLLDEVVAAYDRLVQSLVGARTPEFLDVHISMSQMKVLMLLASAAPMRMSDMAHHLGVSLSTVTGLTDRLVDSGYATRHDDPNDRRQVLVSATPAALAFLDRLQDLSTRRLRELLGRLDEEELALVLQSIEFLARAAAAGPLSDSSRSSENGEITS